MDPNAIAIINIAAEITGPYLSEIARQFDAALADKNTEVIAFRVSSPGGGAVAEVADLANRIFLHRAEKIIIAVAVRECLSAAYHLSSACSEVWATPAASLGAIGAIFAHDCPANFPPSRPDPPSTIQKTFIDRHVREKSLDDILRSVTEDFCGDVARFRNLRIEKVRAIARGKVGYDPKTALDLGLIDQILLK